jgi:hypothetical protein
MDGNIYELFQRMNMNFFLNPLLSVLPFSVWLSFTLCSLTLYVLMCRIWADYAYLPSFSYISSCCYHLYSCRLVCDM